jgi:hypothetical protein
MNWNRKSRKQTGGIANGVIAGLVFVGLVVLLGQAPAIRRYLRMERM